MAKSKSAKKSSSPKSTTGALEVNKNTSASVRQIENGFIVCESGTTGKGRNQNYWSKEYFSANNPLSGVKSQMRFGGKKK